MNISQVFNKWKKNSLKPLIFLYFFPSQCDGGMWLRAKLIFEIDGTR